MKENPVVLIVEDDQFNFDLLAVILMEIKAKVLWAATAAEGLVHFNKEHIDLVLMDIKLPDTSGYELTRQFKAINSKIPIIAQTAYALTGDREKSIEAGCDDYITKPIRKAKIISLIKHHLGMS